MKKNFIAYIATLLLLVGCDYNDKYFDGLDDIVRPSDVKQIEYTLLDADYATIASNSTNKTLAETNGVSSELSKLGTVKAFTETLPASIYAPAFIKTKWNTADNGSAVKLTYSQKVGAPEYVSELNKASIYKVNADDYVSVWGEGSSTNFFTPSTSAKSNIPTILKNAKAEAVAGDIVAVDYNESENEPSGAVVAINEGFESVIANEKVTLDKWNNITTKGTGTWEGRSFSNNGYLNASAYKHDDELEVYMITPQIQITQGLNLTFDACYGNYREEGGRISILVSDNLAGFTTDNINTARWEDITSSFTIEKPAGTYGTLAPAGTHNLDKFIGKKIYIAIRYNGKGSDKATTTVQVDNLVVKSEATGDGEDKYVSTNALYKFDGTNWAAYSGNAYLLNLADFQSMGQRYDNFSASLNADHYLPTFFKLKYPYAKEGDVIAGTYKYYTSETKITSIRSDEYVYTEGVWTKNSGIETITDQFVLSNGKWNFDPSTTIVLPPSKSSEITKLYMQAVVDWVWENIDKGELKLTEEDYKSGKGYVTTYANNDYYTGCSAYNANVDLRPGKAKEQYAAGYEKLSDEQIQSLMIEHLIRAMGGVLSTLNADANLVDGIDVFYTIQLGIYEGSSITECTHQFKYKVTGKGQFEYVEDSFQKL